MLLSPIPIPFPIPLVFIKLKLTGTQLLDSAHECPGYRTMIFGVQDQLQCDDSLYLLLVQGSQENPLLLVSQDAPIKKGRTTQLV